MFVLKYSLLFVQRALLATVSRRSLSVAVSPGFHPSDIKGDFYPQCREGSAQAITRAIFTRSLATKLWERGKYIRSSSFFPETNTRAISRAIFARSLAKVLSERDRGVLCPQYREGSAQATSRAIFTRSLATELWERGKIYSILIVRGASFARSIAKGLPKRHQGRFFPQPRDRIVGARENIFDPLRFFLKRIPERYFLLTDSPGSLVFPHPQHAIFAN